MANTHALLSRGRLQGVPLADLIRKELDAWMAVGSATVEGPDVLLSEHATQTVGMVLHELVTNAAKYGALSTPQGRVSVHWIQQLRENPPMLVLKWRESGGPSVARPTRRGYGTSVICDLIPYELGGTVDLAFNVGGLYCRIEIPVDLARGTMQSGTLFSDPRRVSPLLTARTSSGLKKTSRSLAG